MAALIRDAPSGQLIRFLTGGKYFKYPEENPDFKCPKCYQQDSEESTTKSRNSGELQSTPREKLATPTEPPIPEGEYFEEAESPLGPSDSDAEPSADLTAIRTVAADHQPHLEAIKTVKTHRMTEGIERVGSRAVLSQSITQADLEKAYTQATLPQGPPMPIQPETLDDGTILVDWYTTDDPDNPQNWSLRKKLFIVLQICLYTLAVYMGSAIYAPSEGGVMEEFGVNVQLASMGLSMYVLAYGLGPMIWAPLSEMPSVGRNPPYMATFAIYVVLLVPTALVGNFPGFIVLRFLLGFFGSPCLATGGASLQDMFSILNLPYVMSLWAISATCGPALGPIISGFSVVAENWRWSQWEMLWLAGPVWILMFLTLPETSGDNILLRRAQRLRRLTGDTRLKSASEIAQTNIKVGDLVRDNLLRPNQIMLFDPAVLFSHVYTALIYGIFYSFFEAFPQVYIEGYGFNLGEMGLTFLSITVGVIISISIYWTYIYKIVNPSIAKSGLGPPEGRLIPALFAAFLCPIGLFWFGWTSTPDIHWIVSVIGIVIFSIGIFIIIQCIFLYLPFTYPQYAASLFAGNDLLRSSLAAGAIHFSRPLYGNLGIAKGCSLLGGLTVGCLFGVFGLYFYGAKLRARSRFAAH